MKTADKEIALDLIIICAGILFTYLVMTSYIAPAINGFTEAAFMTPAERQDVIHENARYN